MVRLLDFISAVGSLGVCGKDKGEGDKRGSPIVNDRRITTNPLTP